MILFAALFAVKAIFFCMKLVQCNNYLLKTLETDGLVL